MKKFSKILSVALLVALVLSLGITNAFAEETATTTVTAESATYEVKSKDSTDGKLTITNTGKTQHTFELYEIFVGDVNANGVLSNIEWGADVTDAGQTAFGVAATYAESLSVEADAKAFADALMKGNGTTSYLETPTEKTAAAGADAVFEGLHPGYYMVIDKAESQDGKEDGAYTAYIMQVVGVVAKHTKIDVPTVEKKVKDKNDTAGTTTDWQDSADYDIGDSIPYKITGTLPGNFDEYEEYTTYTFTDTLSKGLTPPTAAGITIKADGVDVKDKFDIAVTAGTEGKNIITISLKSGEDLKKWTSPKLSASSEIVVEYDAVLNSNAEFGSTGNSNEVELEYSNNPNYGGDGTSHTPKDKVIVFTYRPVINKVDKEGKGLEGAGFTLYKEVAGTGSPLTYPTGAKTGAEIKAGYTNPSIEATALKDDSYYVEKAMTLVGTSKTQFEFKGIDDGTYVLVETTIPTGYNAFKSVEIKVDAEHDEEAADPKLTELTVDSPFSAESSTGTVTTYTGNLNAEIENNSGTQLPSTGGIGTTIFYAVGGILVLAAIVLLITKKRMSD